MSVHQKALDSIFNDLDDMESKKMFGDPTAPEGKGVSVLITLTPNSTHEGSKGAEGVDDSMMENLPADHDAAMCGGGCAMHKGGMVQQMASGGIAAPMAPESEDMTLPPFLRKKSKRPMGM